MQAPRLDAVAHEHAAEPRSAWWGMHVARYQLALGHVAGRSVLDVACGTGYGVSILRARARFVIGMDAERTALARGRSTASGRASCLLLGDGCRLPFHDATFDVVTSFETIEHLHDRETFVAELRRVLRPQGLCLLSTPNANYTRPVDGRPRNPYHVHEYTPQELTASLARRFASVELLGQVLSPHVAISPFWDDQERMPRTVRAQGRLLVWRALNKLPRSLADHVSSLLWGHALIPDPDDYRFLPSAVPEAPVLVALCRGGQASAPS